MDWQGGNNKKEGKGRGDKMIPLEKQVTSLELSKRLKESGVKQDSVYYWLDINDEIIDDTDCMLFNYDELVSTDAKNCYSAFTVAELGEMLPDGCYSQRGMRRKEGSKPGTPLALLWICAYKYDAKRAKTEADARAKMRIYLIENKLVEVEAK